MTPRTFRVNKHRSFQYYTPEDVAELRERLANAEAELAKLRERTVVVGIDPGSPGGDRTVVRRTSRATVLVDELCGCGRPADYTANDGGWCCNKYGIRCKATPDAPDPVAQLRDDLCRIKASLPPSAVDAFMRVEAHLTRGAKP